jgi:hypothetical protein
VPSKTLMKPSTVAVRTRAKPVKRGGMAESHTGGGKQKRK